MVVSLEINHAPFSHTSPVWDEIRYPLQVTILKFYCMLILKNPTLPLVNWLVPKKQHSNIKLQYIMYNQHMYSIRHPWLRFWLYACWLYSNDIWLSLWKKICFKIGLLESCLYYDNYKCCIIVNWTLRNLLQWNLNWNTKLFIHENSCILNYTLQNGSHFV